MRAPSFAALLRLAGLAATATGAVLAAAALSSTWEVDGPRAGHAPNQSGWTALGPGALALLAICALVTILAIALCLGPRSRRATRLAGSASLLLLAVALAGVAAFWWVSGTDVSVISDDVRAHDPGPGFGDAATGLVIAVSGVVVMLAGRWQPRRGYGAAGTTTTGPAAPATAATSNADASSRTTLGA